MVPARSAVCPICCQPFKEGDLLRQRRNAPGPCHVRCTDGMQLNDRETGEPIRDDLPSYVFGAPTPSPQSQMAVGKFALGDRVRKTKGSSWNGRIVGFYSTELTPIGYAVESEREPGSVQIYPEAALAKLEDQR